MERERLDLLLKDPSLVDAGDLPALRELVDRHPWFSGAHLLLAAGEQTSGDVLADGTVLRAAAHIPSRQVLFDLVNAVPARRESPAGVPMTAPAPLPDVPGPASASHAAAPEDAIPPAGPVEQGPEPVSEPPASEVPDDPLTGQYEEAILAGGYLVERDAPDAARSEEEVPIPAPGPLSASDAEQVRDRVASAETTPIVVAGTRMRFSEWLAAPSRPVARSSMETSAPASSAEEQAPIGDLIDRFIQSQTPPPKARAAFFKPQDAAKRSLDDEAGLVTETLAKLYTAQGNTAKAIDAYKRLALKHPEKSSYFAALVKALEDKTSN